MACRIITWAKQLGGKSLKIVLLFILENLTYCMGGNLPTISLNEVGPKLKEGFYQLSPEIRVSIFDNQVLPNEIKNSSPDLKYERRVIQSIRYNRVGSSNRGIFLGVSVQRSANEETSESMTMTTHLIDQLPDPQQIKQCVSYDELEKILGRSHFFSDAYGSKESMHRSQSWLIGHLGKNGELEVVEVKANFVAPNMEPINNSMWRVETISVAVGNHKSDQTDKP